MTLAAGERALAAEPLARVVAAADTGARRPKGFAGGVLLAVALAWSLFQLWIASPLPFSLGVFILNDSEARAIHLAFALFLAFAAYPALKSSSRARIPWHDWLLALLGAFCAGYLFLFHAELATRPGLPSGLDLTIAVAGLALLLEAARRVLGLPMVILAVVFLVYIFFGQHMPEVIAHRGASLSKGMSHLWLTTEGVFGVALGVSAGFIFLFVLFGALLETAGAGGYFIRSAIALLGAQRGGPAKAAVMASASTGLISGSSIANVVTTGTFTIPLIKRVGYRADQAAAVEVASSVNGQLMPPVMGAAAFLMVEYVGIPYTEVLKHALLPALISYIALFYIVHLEALKSGLEGIPRRHPSPFGLMLRDAMLTVSGLILFAGVVYFGFGWIKDVAGEAAWLVFAALLFALYLGLVAYGARFPPARQAACRALESSAANRPRRPIFHRLLAPWNDHAAANPAKTDLAGADFRYRRPKSDRLLDAGEDDMRYLPELGPTLKSGLHFLLPVAALIWNLMVEQLSPALSAFWATLFLIFIVVTQRPLFALFRRDGGTGAATLRGFAELRSGLATGARNMVAIGIATAAAGIIVGTVTLTGIGLVMTDLVELVAGGNLMLMLVMVAVVCLILGMGLPTTANYIVVSTLMAPVIVELGAQSGLLVPLIAVHLFVFYFGLMADVTPPVGLASYAAAGIANSDPMRTGLTAFGYSARTAILPFMFIFNTQLLLIGIDHVWQLVFTVGGATLAILLFVAATQGWFLTRNRAHETALLLLIAFSLFRPGYWMDKLYPPFQEIEVGRLFELAERAPAQASLRIRVAGLDLEGREVAKGVLLPLGPPASGAHERLAYAGLGVMAFGGDFQVATVRFGSPAARLGIEPGFTIEAVEWPNERPAKEWMFIPALALLALVIVPQRRRAAAAKRA